MMYRLLILCFFAILSNFSWSTIITVEENGEVYSHQDPNQSNIPESSQNEDQNATLNTATETNTEAGDAQENSVQQLDGTTVNKKVVHAITEIPFGNPKLAADPNRVIEIYVSPTCLHCSHFLTGEFEQFVQEYHDKFFIKLILLPAAAKDLFVMKLIQREVLDANGFFLIFKNFIRRALATFDRIEPTTEQQDKFKGSNSDPDMIKYQVIASEFGFSDDKILKAIPDMSADYEKAVVHWYKNVVTTVSEVLNSKSLNLPMIIYHKQPISKLSAITLPE